MALPVVPYFLGGSDGAGECANFHPQKGTPRTEESPPEAAFWHTVGGISRQLVGNSMEFGCYCCKLEAGAIGVDTFIPMIELSGGYALDWVQYMVNEVAPGLTFDIEYRKSSDQTAPGTVVFAGVGATVEDDGKFIGEYFKRYGDPLTGVTPVTPGFDHYMLGITIKSLATASTGCGAGADCGVGGVDFSLSAHVRNFNVMHQT